MATMGCVVSHPHFLERGKIQIGIRSLHRYNQVLFEELKATPQPKVSHDIPVEYITIFVPIFHKIFK